MVSGGRIVRALLPRVIAHGRWERLVMRLVLAVVAFMAIRWGLPFELQPNPNGLASWGVDFTFLNSWEVMGPLRAGVVVSLMVYVIGWLPVLALVLPLFTLVGVGTLINSQGAINHDTQVVALVLLGQWVAFLVMGIRGGGWVRAPAPAENVAIHVAKLMIVATYVVSAAVKLDESDGRWIHDDVPKLAVQLRKANLSKHASDLQPVDHFAGEVVPEWIIENPWLARGVFGGGLLLELFCFLALAGRRWALAVGLALIAMHLSIGWLMSLHFTFNVALVAAYLVNLPGIAKLAPKKPVAS
ncbi:hypothetical protein BH23VER1_BH23VER1_24660 [soil metagenome]